ncbi:uncharacterized protein G2W53_042493 [Senna tora]|uniref:Uncharacterized protein n=1 Tax=Senna tora TaxID=362788 RepID=A0A834SGZ8_9FABA|nr:uncharacterized protein G2W53_042493 [Senna tora]
METKVHLSLITYKAITLSHFRNTKCHVTDPRRFIKDNLSRC